MDILYFLSIEDLSVMAPLSTSVSQLKSLQGFLTLSF